VKIRSKFFFAFILVIAVAVAVMAFTSRIYISNIFDRYVEGYRNVVLEQWEYLFISYYQDQGGWDGIENFLSKRPARGRGVTMPQGHMKGGTSGILPGERLLLTDKKGEIVLDSNLERTGDILPTSQMEQGHQLYLHEEEIGTLILHSQESTAALTLEEQFSQSIMWAVFWGGMIALLVGVTASLLLTRQITLPLAQLTASARRFAHRDFSHRVQLKRNDEVGNLADAFNIMATNIETNDNLRSNMMADVSHELRTPLTILRGNFEALQAGKVIATPELLSSLYDEVLRIGRLVNDLESINLAEAGKLLLRYKNVEVSDLLWKAAAAFQYEADERGIEFTVEVDRKVQSWFMDEDRMVQVLINLLANAFKFSPDKGKIELLAKEENGSLVVEVKDSGPGIPEEDLPFIFERFYKSSKGRGDGSGLGLSIAKSFVETHGGNIQAYNIHGRGSAFFVTLPPQCDQGSN